MIGMGINFRKIRRRAELCDYASVAQLFLQDNVTLERPLAPDDIKPRLLGHWGTCPGINFIYANLAAYFAEQGCANAAELEVAGQGAGVTDQSLEVAGQNPAARTWQFVLGPGHGFPALQANLWLDGVLAQIDPAATRDAAGLTYLCRRFSAPDGFPSHASPATPGVICEGGELGYALATTYGAALGHPEKIFCVAVGDGELETATALASLNLHKLVGGTAHGRVWPILHLNGYKISAPTLYGRKSERELKQLLRGFGFAPLVFPAEVEACQQALAEAAGLAQPFLVLRSEKGAGGPAELAGRKIAGSHNAHQIPLPAAKTDPVQLDLLARWLESYRFDFADLTEVSAANLVDQVDARQPQDDAQAQGAAQAQETAQPQEATT